VNLAALLRQAPLQSDLNLQAHIEVKGLPPRLAWRAASGRAKLRTLAASPYPSRLQLTHAAMAAFEVQQCDLQTLVARLTAAGLL